MLQIKNSNIKIKNFLKYGSYVQETNIITNSRSNGKHSYLLGQPFLFLQTSLAHMPLFVFAEKLLLAEDVFRVIDSLTTTNDILVRPNQNINNIFNVLSMEVILTFQGKRYDLWSCMFHDSYQYLFTFILIQI